MKQGCHQLSRRAGAEHEAVGPRVRRRDRLPGGSLAASLGPVPFHEVTLASRRSFSWTDETTPLVAS